MRVSDAVGARLLRRVQAVTCETGTDDLAIFGELTGQEEFRRIVLQATCGDWFDDSLWKSLSEMPQVRLEATNHHRVELARPHWDPAREALRIKDFKETGEGIRVATSG